MSVAISPERARELAERAYIYGFAIAENYKAMYGMAIAEGSPVYSGFNRYLHGRRLFDADYTTVVNANNDTLYSTAFADLRAEPIVITVPPTGDRYFTIQLVDMGTDNIAYLGRRGTGPDGGTFLLVGPSFAGELPDAGFDRVILAPSEFIALATRTAIDGPEDLPGVIAIQDGLRIQTLGEFVGGEAAPPPPAIDFPPYDPSFYGTTRLFDLLNFLLPFHAPTASDRALLAEVAAIGVGPYREFSLERFEPEVQTAILEGITAAHARIGERGNALGTVIDGWQEIPPMGTYGDDYLFRSAVAWKFIYTNSPEEALYPIAETDADGEPLTGERRYVLNFPPGALPPVHAFWSVTLYDSISRLMVHNPIERYAIGDRTPGLRFAEDGSLTILIQHERPAPEEESNWLPSPPGRFYLNARAYIPDESMIRGEYRLPAVQRLD